MRRIIGRFLLGFILLLILAVTGIWAWLHTGLPQTSGERELPGLEQKAEVTRDKWGVPTVEAASRRDAIFALGFVHAQDRFWQMDFMRRLGAGRLSEVVGPPTLRTDRLMRTLGIYRLAERGVENLDPPARQLVDAYTAGVNSWLQTRGGAWPPEFYVLRYRPEPWKAADSLVWGRLMAVLLSRNWNEEVLRAGLEQKLGEKAAELLLPAYPTDAPRTLAGFGLPNPLAENSASNGWVVSGAHTATGAPILANDPHLRFRAPAIWYLARLKFPDGEITGATVPGVPFSVLGHNGRIAWGFTTAETDTQDLFVETLIHDDPDRYRTATGQMRFTIREETIRVRGEADRTLRIRTGRYGPVISDVSADLKKLAGPGRVVSIRATGLSETDRTPNALFGLNTARNWTEFSSALRDWATPHQNIFYADADRNIGLIAPARVPDRDNHDGARPVTDPAAPDPWAGFVDFNALPIKLNPSGGVIFNANNPTRFNDPEKAVDRNRTPGYRAQRLAETLPGVGKHTADASARLQSDIVSLMARDLLPLLLKPDFTTPQSQTATGLLRDWDGRMDRNRPEPVIFTNWVRQLNRLIFEDELGELFPEWFGLRPLSLKRVLTEAPEWCDDKRTPAMENCANRIKQALENSLAQVAHRFGTDIRAWKWGDLHIARFNHSVFGRIPVLRELGNITLPVDGGADTLNRGNMRIGSDRDPFSSIHGASYRAIYDLANLDRSRFIVAPGQSGHVLSPHYGDLASLWRDRGYIELKVKPAADKKLILLPAPVGK